jgi:hypothetical protein
MDLKESSIEALTLEVDEGLFLGLDELESRLEQQIGAFPMGPEDEGCLWYLCNPKCEGSKCVTVCPIAQ